MRQLVFNLLVLGQKFWPRVEAFFLVNLRHIGPDHLRVVQSNLSRTKTGMYMEVGEAWRFLWRLVSEGNYFQAYWSKH